MKIINETILIIDYGSQYTQLIARKIREQNVYCVVYPYNKISSSILNNKGFSVNDVKPSIALVDNLRKLKIKKNYNTKHKFVKYIN